jgi:hypothetical protein
VTAIWIDLDSGTLISTHMRFNVTLRNMRRDPRVVLTFAPPQQPGDWMSPRAVIYATATIGPLGPTGPLLSRLAKAYVGPDAAYPDETQTGCIVRYRIDRIGGIGPWAGGPDDRIPPTLRADPRCPLPVR